LSRFFSGSVLAFIVVSADAHTKDKACLVARFNANLFASLYLLEVFAPFSLYEWRIEDRLGSAFSTFVEPICSHPRFRLKAQGGRKEVSILTGIHAMQTGRAMIY